MIKFITADDVLPIRNEVLREGKLTLDECRFVNDEKDSSFHLGYFVKDELACIASFHEQGYKDFEGLGYQLRGMATLENYRGKGYGAMLVNFAITYLRGRQVNYMWCNARKKAVPFYLSVGFEIVSPEFDIPGIGPHHAMYVKIR
ncbi:MULTISPECIES: GNAT family N-acetyltransferase [unclassified Mucilaginibacter]|uniref:GNAT family N-acetyltransferase n=1 Tax=unclassified Mucilaginibacter TaxID=2617802 RepID=UPI00095D346A|nr:MULTISPECIES: GNAT family N-acetyltransferase [unclassified Mucilaginibacter]OJW15050.1 MAG: GNAT family N-acetyltransferase [Mucilaginibacter sp. 44-25]PLW89669.1 MAG: GNAT family N-acetyltransferase [Mucilaginibacter sp.]PMP65165.1 MAG: GNAT family N-acetyltransferase [Mucilaginibacter sp.]HEK21156.1 GNAT family N-acetyltransferase [Bacteroidota bacterium]